MCGSLFFKRWNETSINDLEEEPIRKRSPHCICCFCFCGFFTVMIFCFLLMKLESCLMLNLLKEGRGRGRKTLGLHLNQDINCINCLHTCTTLYELPLQFLPFWYCKSPKYATSGGHYQCRKLPQCIFGGFSILGRKSKFRDNGEIIGCYK